MDTSDKKEENEENNRLYTKLKKLNIKSNKPKKRTYNEMIESHKNIKSIEEESEISDSTEKIIKKKLMKNFFKKEDYSHYYYTDNAYLEWELTEINGSKQNFYFKCSTKGCKAFGMINRNSNKKIFILT